MYVYPSTGQPVPSSIEVVRVPAGISDRYPLGGFFTVDGVQVTKLNEGTGPLPTPTDPSKVGMATGDFQVQVLTALAELKALIVEK